MSNVYKIDNKKFKSIYLSINFTMPVNTKEISENAVLSSIFSKSCEKYQTQKEIEEYLCGLYGANFDTNIELYGDLYNIEFRMEFVNKVFLPNKVDVLNEILDFLYNIIYIPTFKNGIFDEEFIKREKEFIIDKIKEKKDNKIRYAISRTEEIMCKGEPFGASIYGFEEDVKKVDSNSLYKRYLNIINNSCITIITAGNLEGYENIESEIKNVFKEKIDSNIEYKNLNINTRSIDVNNLKIEELEEKQDTAQSVVTFGLRVKDFELEDYYALNVYNSILGSSPSSKLFQIFREKESLAYTVRSRFYRFKNIIIIFAGIQKKNYNRAKEVIIEQLKNIENGNITEDEFYSAKRSLIADIEEWNDSKISLSKMLISNLIVTKNNNVTLDDMINGIKKVTVNDVERMAKKIEIEKIFLLGGIADV